jgi:hypothetical protein
VAVGAPAADDGYPPGLRHIDVNHGPGTAGGDPFRSAIVLPIGVQVAAPPDPDGYSLAVANLMTHDN